MVDGGNTARGGLKPGGIVVLSAGLKNGLKRGWACKKAPFCNERIRGGQL